MTTIETIEDICNKIIEECKLPVGTLFIETNKDNSSSVWIRNPTTMRKSSLAIKIYEVPKLKLIIRDKIKTLDNVCLPSCATTGKIMSAPLYSYVKFNMLTEDFFSFIKDVIIYCVSIFEPDDKFGCCGKYIECSDQKECLHENKFYARACWYRKNLEKGKIFYGINKNV